MSATWDHDRTRIHARERLIFQMERLLAGKETLERFLGNDCPAQPPETHLPPNGYKGLHRRLLKYLKSGSSDCT